MKLDQGFNSPDVVGAYNQGRPPYPESIINFLIEEEILRSGDVLADIGTGNGRFLSTLFNASSDAAQGLNLRHIHAVDSSQNMLAEVDKRFINQQNISTHLGRFQNLPLADNSVDVISCFSSIHWGTATPQDRRKTKKEFNRVLKPGGRIIVSSDYWNIKKPLGAQLRALSQEASSQFSKKHTSKREYGTLEQWRFLFQEKEPLSKLAYYALIKKYFPKKFKNEYKEKFNILSEKKFIPMYRLFQLGAKEFFTNPLTTKDIFYSYDMDANAIRAEFASQIFIDTLPKADRKKFDVALNTFIEKNFSDSSILTCPRSTFITAGKFNF